MGWNIFHCAQCTCLGVTQWDLIADTCHNTGVSLWSGSKPPQSLKYSFKFNYLCFYVLSALDYKTIGGRGCCRLWQLMVICQMSSLLWCCIYMTMVESVSYLTPNECKRSGLTLSRKNSNLKWIALYTVKLPLVNTIYYQPSFTRKYLWCNDENCHV